MATQMSFSGFVSSAVAEDDIKCLEGVKKSVNDPQGKLSSWSFANSSIGFICKFVGVTCWNDRENRILNLELREMTLSGQVPESLKYCRSMQKLDLSANSLSGTIPAQICTWLPYIVTLDLSNNDFSGSIPPDLGNCTYLNNLILSNNHLSGSIPYELSKLSRLKKFSIADNELSGTVPFYFEGFDKGDFGGNNGLCGRPLDKCGQLSKKNLAIIIAAGVFGAAASLLLGFGLWWWYHLRWIRKRKRRYGFGRDDDSRWAEKLRAHKLVQVSLFQKPLVKVKLADLMAATNNFSAENIIISTRTGTTYKAMLPDGSALAVKRLNTCKLGEKQFRSEMNRLGQLRHPNLAPLLGFSPELPTTMVASLKGDVYGFGVVLLELVTGQKPLEVGTAAEGSKLNLVDRVTQISTSGGIKDAVDKALCGKGYDEEIMQFLKIACSCVVSRPKDRWSMYQVYQSLDSIAEKHGSSQRYDEFPLIFVGQDNETA
ncbi:hypothetical protein Pint_19357 [Pistacia integerrima]|uniref:Uncharacterized protein n=1 Tax=Pistacia integerrima TaxID=434235 RepID=A0ACC0YYS1_9ROSI|nr:hypothetical protein Pint_19357 [Pistacia integerrima]